MPRLVLLLILDNAIGLLIACVAVGALMWFDYGRLGHLLTGPDGTVATIALTLSLAALFGATQFAVRVWLMGRDP